MKITLIVPVCNPQVELFRLSVVLQQTGAVRVIFVDDGTTQKKSVEMLEKAQAAGCAVLSMPAGVKPGNAAKRGLTHYLRNTLGHAGAITMGLNSVLDEEALKRMVRRMPRNGQALVLGAREAIALTLEEQQRTARARALLLEYGCSVSDPLSGVCLFSNALAHACVNLPQEGINWQINLLLAAAQNKIAVHEILLFEGKRDEVFKKAFNVTQDEILPLTQKPSDEEQSAKEAAQALRLKTQTAPETVLGDEMLPLLDLETLWEDTPEVQREEVLKDVPNFSAPRKWCRKNKKKK